MSIVQALLMMVTAVELPPVYDPLSVTSEGASASTSCIVQLNINADGTWETLVNGITSQSGNWAQPTIPPNVGDLFWVKFTRTAVSTSGDGDLSSTDTTSWTQLTTNQGVVVTAADLGAGTTGNSSATYTIELAGDEFGSNIVSTTTDIALTAEWTI